LVLRRGRLKQHAVGIGVKIFGIVEVVGEGDAGMGGGEELEKGVAGRCSSIIFSRFAGKHA